MRTPFRTTAGGWACPLGSAARPLGVPRTWSEQPRLRVRVPSDERIVERAELSAPEAQSRRAAYLLQAYGHNNEVAALKVGYLKAAAMWFRLALVALVVLTAALAFYVGCH
jgi:hypothetical protein